jgi:hypothetical protein
MIGQHVGGAAIVGQAPKMGTFHAATVRCDCGSEKSAPWHQVVAGEGLRCKACSNAKRGKQMRGKPLVEHNANAWSRYCGYRISATQRGHLFRLSFEDFLEITGGDCTYCGQPPSNSSGQHTAHAPFAYSGIDRVENDVGYLKENCVPCCTLCNVAKGTQTVDQFRMWVRRAHQHLK